MEGACRGGWVVWPFGRFRQGGRASAAGTWRRRHQASQWSLPSARTGCRSATRGKPCGGCGPWVAVAVGECRHMAAAAAAAPDLRCGPTRGRRSGLTRANVFVSSAPPGAFSAAALVTRCRRLSAGLLASAGRRAPDGARRHAAGRNAATQVCIWGSVGDMWWVVAGGGHKQQERGNVTGLQAKGKHRMSSGVGAASAPPHVTTGSPLPESHR